jgi:hypothetical protein
LLCHGLSVKHFWGGFYKDFLGVKYLFQICDLQICTQQKVKNKFLNSNCLRKTIIPKNCTFN